MNEVISTAQTSAFLLLEQNAYSGVQKIGTVVSKDFFAVTGIPLILISSLDQFAKATAQTTKKTLLFICGTVGKSDIINSLSASKKIDVSQVSGKNEVYSFGAIDEINNVAAQTIFVIAGSDKRGTIYGLLHISELLGVSPWTWWGEVHPAHKDDIVFDTTTYISPEPSVELRGIFINDEWPAFGQWVNEKFGGFNAKMYEHVFILLLRLKANYLWPAMWTSSFSLDGPGSANEALADEYGIIIGYSHHEPCLRASEEWDKVKGKDTPYGTAWDFHSNAEGLTNYWRDSLTRSGKYENTITVGMRGERDSILMKTATLDDNIATLKNIITTQNKLISENVNKDLLKTRRVLAVYKEVETYFEGDEHTDGLKKWSGLDGITCMLCDDNFGNLRVLPSPEQKNRNGGWGMYYHFDYHGGPCSYEWMNSSSIVKTNREMVRAYTSGIKKIWIVNVGDIVGNELPISYFTDLAYNFTKYSPLQAASSYTSEWVAMNFSSSNSKSSFTKQQLDTCTELLNSLQTITYQRKSESLNETIYHPCHYHESERMFLLADDACKKADDLLQHSSQSGDSARNSFIALVYYPVVATLNLVKMHTAASMNKLLSSHGSVFANEYDDIVQACIARDEQLKQLYYSAADGKWRHFADSAHTGFRTWNNEDWRWPVTSRVTPINGSKMIVSFTDSEHFSNGGFWCGQQPLENDELTNQSVDTICADISNGGNKPFSYTVTCDADWLSVGTKTQDVASSGTVTIHERLFFTADRTKFSGQKQAHVRITGSFGNEAPVTVTLIITATNNNYSSYPQGTYIESQHFISMPADTQTQSSTQFTFITTDGAAQANHTLSYTARLYFESTNPSTRDGLMKFSLEVNGNKQNNTPHGAISLPYATDTSCADWSKAVLSNTRIVEHPIEVNEGLNTLSFVPIDNELVLKHIVLFARDKRPPESYLPPPHSFMVP